MVLEKLEPKLVWDIFENLVAKSPRPSGKEEIIRKNIKAWVKARSNERNIEILIKEDKIGNLVLKIPASKNCKQLPSVILQAHLDMVCETNRKDGFDFNNSPIPIRIQKNNEWIDADGTTLGADDGIGLALSLAVSFCNDSKFNHGPLELLFTVEEETGLTGAFGLDNSFFRLESQYLVNLDGGTLGTIIIGCAGGAITELTKNRINIQQPLEEEIQFFQLKVFGLKGGHSGVEIHHPLANANVLITQFLSILKNETKIYLSQWNGGKMSNAIPRESIVKFALPSKNIEILKHKFSNFKSKIFEYYNPTSQEDIILEPNMNITLELSNESEIISAKVTSQVISSLNLIPHGVIRFSPSIPNLVETSNNFAIIKSNQKEIVITTFTRSSINNELINFKELLKNIAFLAEWEINFKSTYSGWKPEPNRSFVKYIQKKYEEKLGRSVRIEAIHAGLECGILGDKLKEIQMVSMLPITEGEHTPDERVNISSVGFIYELLKEILMNIKNIK